MKRNPAGRAAATTPAIRFGDVPLTAGCSALRNEMNQEMMGLLRSLPASVHTDAVILLMEHFRTPFFPEFNYFRNYHAPAWSILYWLERMGPGRDAAAVKVNRHAMQAHAMALFLHPLDDHLNDGQLPATHLHLLLRSQAWLRMNTALERLAAGVADGALIVRGFIDDYYASIGSPPVVATLEAYCAHFRNQMATWMTVPILMAVQKACDAGFTDALQKAYGSFGIAWRLMDDLQDMETDLANGSHSAIYCCLPDNIRQLWDQPIGLENRGRLAKIRAAVNDGGTLETLRIRICKELASAATTMDAIQMTGLAEELRCLVAPVMGGPAGS